MSLSELERYDEMVGEKYVLFLGDGDFKETCLRVSQDKVKNVSSPVCWFVDKLRKIVVKHKTTKLF